MLRWFRERREQRERDKRIVEEIHEWAKTPDGIEATIKMSIALGVLPKDQLDSST